MANQKEIEETYDYMDEFFRLSLGENADISCAFFNGDFSKTLEQAQKDKHDYILNGINCKAGSRVLDIGCGWGPILKAVKERGGHAIGLTLSPKQAEACKRSGFEVYIMNWKEINIDTFGKFDCIVGMGVLEHASSAEEYLAGKQDQIYDHFFHLCHDLLPEGGRLFVQTMMLGKNAPKYEHVSLKAKKGSNEYILAVVEKFYPGSFPPLGEEQILEAAQPYFELISDNNGRLDYLATMKQWGDRMRKLNFAKLVAASKLFPRFLTNKDFRYKMEELRGAYNKECFKREVLDHQRMIFQKK